MLPSSPLFVFFVENIGGSFLGQKYLIIFEKEKVFVVEVNMYALHLDLSL
jgi:hypothetical protein